MRIFSGYCYAAIVIASFLIGEVLGDKEAVQLNVCTNCAPKCLTDIRPGSETIPFPGNGTDPGNATIDSSRTVATNTTNWFNGTDSGSFSSRRFMRLSSYMDMTNIRRTFKRMRSIYLIYQPELRMFWCLFTFFPLVTAFSGRTADAGPNTDRSDMTDMTGMPETTYPPEVTYDLLDPDWQPAPTFGQFVSAPTNPGPDFNGSNWFLAQDANLSGLQTGLFRRQQRGLRRSRRSPGPGRPHRRSSVPGRPHRRQKRTVDQIQKLFQRVMRRHLFRLVSAYLSLLGFEIPADKLETRTLVALSMFMGLFQGFVSGFRKLLFATPLTCFASYGVVKFITWVDNFSF
ncbi:unnamed protein product [Bemisia tabaci]|uniref:Uncharacterized protein n=2 Tax=Bemisia tabaci TaxID=7038 RepID=A0A9P0CD66_BEMTA|nr:unnamed protein product [Bemisia tabaci]